MKASVNNILKEAYSYTVYVCLIMIRAVICNGNVMTSEL